MKLKDRQGEVESLIREIDKILTSNHRIWVGCTIYDNKDRYGSSDLAAFVASELSKDLRGALRRVRVQQLGRLLAIEKRAEEELADARANRAALVESLKLGLGGGAS